MLISHTKNKISLPDHPRTFCKVCKNSAADNDQHVAVNAILIRSAHKRKPHHCWKEKNLHASPAAKFLGTLPNEVFFANDRNLCGFFYWYQIVCGKAFHTLILFLTVSKLYSSIFYSLLHHVWIEVLVNLALLQTKSSIELKGI